MPQQQLLLLLLSLLSLLSLASLPPAAAQAPASINFAVVWNTDGIGPIAESLFNRLFLPQLNRTCPLLPGVNETKFHFIEVTQKYLFDLKLAEQQIANLSVGGCLFIGANSRPELAVYSSAGIGSGVPGFASSASVHEIAPLPVPLAADALFRALSVSLGSDGGGARRLAVIVGDGYELREFESLVRRFSGNFFCFKLRRGSEDAVVQQAKASGATNLLLAAPAQEAEALLESAFYSLMLAPMYRWFFYNSRLVDKNNFSGFKIVSKNITSMEFGPIQTAIANNLTLAREIYLYDLFSVWMVYLRKIVCRESGEVNQTYTGMTGNFLLQPNGSVSRLDWTMNFYIGLGSERQRAGNWSSSGTFHFKPPPMRIATDAVLRSELNKNKFKVVTLLKRPFVQFKPGFENATGARMYDRLEGFAIDMCKQVLKNMSLENVEFFLQPDGNYGSRDSAGNWNGIVGTLVRGSADLACLSLSYTEERESAIKFTTPILSYQMSILYRKKQQNPLNYMFQFMQPLHFYSWIGVIGSVLVLALVLSVLHRLSRNAVSFSLYDSIFFSFASLIQGITGTPPDRPSGQLVIAVYWLFAFVVLVAYVTNYAALRTLDRLQADITSLDSLLSQSSYTYGTISDSSYLSLFETSTIVARQQMYRHMIADSENRLPQNLSAALRLVSNYSYAFIQDAPSNDYYAQRICGSVSVGSFGSDSTTFGMPMTAEYDSMVSRIVISLINSGERDRLYSKYFALTEAEKPDCSSKVFPDLLRDYIPAEPAFFETKPGALTLNNTLGIAVINILGCVLTLLLAGVEFVFEKCSKWLKRRREAREGLAKEEASVDFHGALVAESSA